MRKQKNGLALLSRNTRWIWEEILGANAGTYNFQNMINTNSEDYAQVF